MPVYSKIYCIGDRGGFRGAEGINPIYLQIMVGAGYRQWFEPYYVDKSFRPLGKIGLIIPQNPEHPEALLDACIVFFPEHFRDCPSFQIVAKKIKDMIGLDFDLGKREIPQEWEALRREAWPKFKALNIYEADLRRVELNG